MLEGKKMKRFKDEKRNKEKRLRKIVRLEHPRNNQVIGIWDAIYKKGSLPETEHSVQYYTPK